MTLEARNEPAAHSGVTGGPPRLVSVATQSDVEPTSALAGARRLELLTLDELGALLKVRKSWLYDEVESGRLPAIRLGRQLRFRIADVEAYLIRAASV